MSWHADRATIEAYLAGRIGPTGAQSVEQHLMACGACRDRVRAGSDHARQAAIWTEIVDELDQPTPSMAERALRRIGVEEATARLLAVTPSLRAPYLLGLVLTVASCVVAANTVGSGAPAVFLAIAPILPLAAVAVAFVPPVDPAAELTRAAPMSNVRLLFLRTAVVLAATVPLVLVAGLLVDAPGLAETRWLLPSAAMIAVSLALSTHVDPLRSATAVGGAWVVTIAVVATRAGTARAGSAAVDFVAFAPAGQLASVALALAAGTWLVARRDAIEIRRSI